jgi:DNA topoisomerase-1
MVIKFGRFGQFLACSNYPECRTTREISKPQHAASDGESVTSASSLAASAGRRAEAGAADAEEAEECELCGKPMALKRGRFGQFLGCTGYPECRNIRKIAKSGQPAPAPVPLDEKCPVDGAQLVLRHGRFGEFISCSNYPKCSYIKRETTGVACPRPGCRGEIVVKKSKRGKAFYGCSEYPKCDVVFWDKPVAEQCPKCNAPFLLEKTTKKEGIVRYCAKEGCDYRAEQGTTAPVVQPATPAGRDRRIAG